MSWFNKLFGKCCDDSGSCCGDEKQEMDPATDSTTEPETPEVPVVGEDTPTVE
ncbi:hypothetical protein HN358_02380 [Candidatus Uhrbacteria bacterium]|jgi:hypothetical protein|nr:hypothetical protein [Candidatus Uhrbacteria bacterium]MBT7717526.1 hypothetical protein [Candidatus Uhrbacteria bacterium]